MVDGALDIISPESAASLAGLFRERVRRTPDAPAYYYFNQIAKSWQFNTWAEMAQAAGRWQAGFRREGLVSGDRIAIMARNCREWVCCDQAALGLGLVVVPLYANDRAENAAYILRDAGVKWLLIEGEEHWQALRAVHEGLGEVACVVSMEDVASDGDDRLRAMSEWLPSDATSSILSTPAGRMNLPLSFIPQGLPAIPRALCSVITISCGMPMLVSTVCRYFPRMYSCLFYPCLIPWNGLWDIIYPLWRVRGSPMPAPFRCWRKIWRRYGRPF